MKIRALTPFNHTYMQHVAWQFKLPIEINTKCYIFPFVSSIKIISVLLFINNKNPAEAKNCEPCRGPTKPPTCLPPTCEILQLVAVAAAIKRCRSFFPDTAELPSARHPPKQHLATHRFKRPNKQMDGNNKYRYTRGRGMRHES